VIRDGSIILHDCGDAFEELENLPDFKAKSLVTIKYEPDIHHLLSPNDNKWHGVGKCKWRGLCNARMLDKTEGVESSLLLLKCLLDAKASSIRKYFKRNLFIRQCDINDNAIKKLVTEDKKFLYRSDKVEKTMTYFSRWRRGRLRDTRIKFIPNQNIESKNMKLLTKILSS